ncbi:hypothetical protein TNCV_4138301 [Trichonephila clavipes]|nr:hypothetical protein TNCV_4138301 [Trichonephila clavipes]
MEYDLIKIDGLSSILVLVMNSQLVLLSCRIRVLVLWTIRFVKELMAVKSVVAQSSHVGVMWKFDSCGVNSSVVQVPKAWFKITKSVSNSLRGAI